jgi:hypothetical protein
MHYNKMRAYCRIIASNPHSVAVWSSCSGEHSCDVLDYLAEVYIRWQYSGLAICMKKLGICSTNKYVNGLVVSLCGYWFLPRLEA